MQTMTMPDGTVRLRLADGAHLEMAAEVPIWVDRRPTPVMMPSEAPYNGFPGVGRMRHQQGPE